MGSAKAHPRARAETEEAVTPRQNTIARAFFEGAGFDTIAEVIERPQREVEAIVRQWMRERDEKRRKQ